MLPQTTVSLPLFHQHPTQPLIIPTLVVTVDETIPKGDRSIDLTDLLVSSRPVLPQDRFPTTEYREPVPDIKPPTASKFEVLPHDTPPELLQEQTSLRSVSR